MRIDVPDSAITISTEEAFRLLCKSLMMDFVLDEDIEFFVRKNSDGNNYVYITHNGEERKYDDRGDLFVTLRNVAVQTFPNLAFRSADYIYHK
jgi:hypothetical protein